MSVETEQYRGIFPPGAVDYALDRLFPKPHPYLDDPVGWCTGNGDFIWSKQKEILESVRDNRYTAVKSCHGPGKSFISSRAVGWWLDTHPLGQAFAVTTAPTGPQVGAILWREIRRMHKVFKLAGRTTLDNHWYMSENNKRNAASPEDELIAYGRKPADYDQAAFQGIHARYVLVVVDEACGVPKQLFDAIDSIVTNKNSRVLAIGNPDDPSEHFKSICDSEQWNLIHIPAWVCPAFTGEYVPEEVAEGLVSKEWVQERADDWGEESALYVAKIHAEFPDVSDETMFPPFLIKKAHDNNLPGLEPGRYGFDVARMGADKNMIYRNRGGCIRYEDGWSKVDTMRSAGRAHAILMRHGVERVPMIIDIIGVGSGPFDRLREQDMPVVAFQGSEKAFDPSRFQNRRAEVYWAFRDAMEQREIDLDPADTILAAELSTIKWWPDSSGRVVVESKEDMRKRGVRSPNRADAAVMSFIGAQTSADFMNQKWGQTISGDILTRKM